MQRRVFDVVAIISIVGLLAFVIYNGKYIQLFNDKFMVLSTSHSRNMELNKGINDTTSDDSEGTSIAKNTSLESETNAAISSNETVASDDANNASVDDTNGSDKSKYLDVDVYDIVWGDTLSGISRLTGTSVDELVKLNSIENPNLIYSGSSIKIRQVR